MLLIDLRRFAYILSILAEYEACEACNACWSNSKRAFLGAARKTEEARYLQEVDLVQAIHRLSSAWFAVLTEGQGESQEFIDAHASATKLLDGFSWLEKDLVLAEHYLEPCGDWIGTGGRCIRGTRCRFGHPTLPVEPTNLATYCGDCTANRTLEYENRPRYPPNFTEFSWACRYWEETGQCTFSECPFRHS